MNGTPTTNHIKVEPVKIKSSQFKANFEIDNDQLSSSIFKLDDVNPYPYIRSKSRKRSTKKESKSVSVTMSQIVQNAPIESEN
jgi:hypothetical protein